MSERSGQQPPDDAAAAASRDRGGSHPGADSERHPSATADMAVPMATEGRIAGRPAVPLWLQVVIGLIAGVAVGLLLGEDAGLVARDTATTATSWLALPGRLFLALIQMIIVPLVISSVMRGVAEAGDIGRLRTIGVSLGAYFVLTTVTAATIGIGLGILLDPGASLDPEKLQASIAHVPSAVRNDPFAGKSLPEIIVGLLPSNPLDAAVSRDMLAVVLGCMIAGAALLAIPRDAARPVLDFLGSVQAVCMKIVAWAMVLAPLAVFGLLAQVTAGMGYDVLKAMTHYMGTVLLGLLCLFGAYMGLVWFGGGMHPRRFLAGIGSVQLMAFSTSSSAAVLPLSLRAAEEKLGIRPEVSRFVIPLGATINMDGTTVYQAIAAIFLARAFGVDIDLTDMVLIVVTTTAASIGAPAAPGTGLIILAMVLRNIDVPPEGIAVILGVDRLLDMCRTVINVTGDLTAATVMNRWTRPIHAPAAA